MSLQPGSNPSRRGSLSVGGVPSPRVLAGTGARFRGVRVPRLHGDFRFVDRF